MLKHLKLKVKFTVLVHKTAGAGTGQRMTINLFIAKNPVFFAVKNN